MGSNLNNTGPVVLKNEHAPKGDLRKLSRVYALRVKEYMSDVHAEILLGTHDDTRRMEGRFLLMASKLEDYRSELSDKTIDEITQLDMTGCDYIIFKVKSI